MTPELAKLTQEVMDLACRITALEFRIAQLQPKVLEDVKVGSSC